MPRQKLPEGYKYSATGRYAESVALWPALSTRDGALVVEDRQNLVIAPTSVALAVIRNAGLDPLLDMAKRVVAEPMVTIEERLSELARLIKSMEEP